MGLTCIPLWLLVIGVSQTSLKVGGFQSKALLAFSEADGSQETYENTTATTLFFDATSL